MRVAQRLAGLLARGGRQPPQGDGQEDPRAHREGALEVRRRLRRAGPRPRVRRADLRHHRAVRRLLVQQVALGRLRLRRVPDRVPEGEPPGRVPRRAAHERQDATRTRPRSSSTSAASSGIPVLVPDVNESESDFSVRDAPEGKKAIRFGLSAVRNVGEGVVAHIVAARRGGRAVHRLLRLLRPRRPARC